MADWIVEKLPFPDGSTYTLGYFIFGSLKWKLFWNFAFPSTIIPMKEKKIRIVKKKEAIFLRKKIISGCRILQDYTKKKNTTIYRESPTVIQIYIEIKLEGK